MFENCSIIIIANGSHVDELYRLEVDADTQKEICLSFDSAVDDLLSEKSDKLSFEDTEAFKNTANTWIRRKIAMINDSGVLVNYKASEIKKLAKDAGITIAVENKKVVIPNDKEQIKVILGFLDEEAYKGPFSQNTFLANSKRRVNK